MNLDQLHAAAIAASDKYIGAINFYNAMRAWLPEAAASAAEAELNRLAAVASAASLAYEQAMPRYTVVGEAFQLPIAA